MLQDGDLSRISHDLRGSFATVSGFSALIRTHYAAEVPAEILDGMGEATENLEETLEAVAALVNAALGARATESVDLGSVVLDVAGLLSGRIAVEVDEDGADWPLVQNCQSVVRDLVKLASRSLLAQNGTDGALRFGFAQHPDSTQVSVAVSRQDGVQRAAEPPRSLIWIAAEQAAQAAGGSLARRTLSGMDEILITLPRAAAETTSLNRSEDRADSHT